LKSMMIMMKEFLLVEVTFRNGSLNYAIVNLYNSQSHHKAYSISREVYINFFTRLLVCCYYK